MRHNWEYRKIGEICNIKTGKLDANASSENGEYPFFTCSKETLRIDNYSYDEECVLIAGNGDLNVKYYKGKFDAYQRTYIVTLKDKNEELSVPYLYQFFSKYIEHLRKVSIGGIIKYIKLNNLTDAEIPVPPLPTQRAIVAELDTLNEILDKKRQQLKELDTLAQSIFYDMFGDPVENEKGWEVKRLEDYCEVSSSKRVLVEDVVESGIPFLRGTELTILNKVSSSKDVQFTMFITPEHYERVKAITGVPKKGDILIPSINSEGISWVVDTEDPFYFKDGRVIWVHVNHDAFSSKYLKYAISQVLKANYSVLTSGATFLELKLFIVRDLNIPIPPLPLQQSFAQKIEAIEKQKELINASIKEVETLLNARMGYYFGE